MYSILKPGFHMGCFCGITPLPRHWGKHPWWLIPSYGVLLAGRTLPGGKLHSSWKLWLVPLSLSVSNIITPAWWMSSVWALSIALHMAKPAVKRHKWQEQACSPDWPVHHQSCWIGKAYNTLIVLLAVWHRKTFAVKTAFGNMNCMYSVQCHPRLSLKYSILAVCGWGESALGLCWGLHRRAQVLIVCGFISNILISAEPYLMLGPLHALKEASSAYQSLLSMNIYG